MSATAAHAALTWVASGRELLKIKNQNMETVLWVVIGAVILIIIFLIGLACGNSSGEKPPLLVACDACKHAIYKKDAQRVYSARDGFLYYCKNCKKPYDEVIYEYSYSGSKYADEGWYRGGIPTGKKFYFKTIPEHRQEVTVTGEPIK